MILRPRFLLSESSLRASFAPASKAELHERIRDLLGAWILQAAAPAAPALAMVTAVAVAMAVLVVVAVAVVLY